MKINAKFMVVGLVGAGLALLGFFFMTHLSVSDLPENPIINPPEEPLKLITIGGLTGKESVPVALKILGKKSKIGLTMDRVTSIYRFLEAHIANLAQSISQLALKPGEEDVKKKGWWQFWK